MVTFCLICINVYFQQEFYQKNNNKMKIQINDIIIINNINLMIHYNHIEIFPKEGCEALVV